MGFRFLVVVPKASYQETVETERLREEQAMLAQRQADVTRKLNALNKPTVVPTPEPKARQTMPPPNAAAHDNNLSDAESSGENGSGEPHEGLGLGIVLCPKTGRVF